MQTANAYGNDDMPDAPGAGCIDPEALRAARERRGLTQSQLADEVGCGKDTVSRWERGHSHRLQPRHRESLCAALGVRWHALAESGSGGPDDISRDIRVGSAAGEDIRTAFRLAAERYDIGVHDVMKTAPLLFVIAAERSLIERRRQLEAARAEVDGTARALADNAPHLGRAVEEAVRKEEKSIAENDIFGRLVRSEGDGEDDRGPFARFLRDLASDLPESATRGFLPAPETGVESPATADDASRDTAEAWDRNSVLRRLFPHFRTGRIAIGEYLRAKRERDEAGYRQWVTDALARAEEGERDASPGPAGT